MNRSVLCSGCGGRVEAPPEHKRNKMRCPHCGVICELPPRPADSPLPRPDLEPAAPNPADNLLSELAREETVDKPSAPAAPRPTPAAPAKTVSSRKKRLDQCPRCGEPLSAAAAPRHSQTCPVCAWSSAEENIQAGPGPKNALTDRTPAPAPRPRRPEDEDGPYQVAANQVRNCPGCSQALEEQAVVCVVCGLDLETGAQITREYQPLHYYWESGLSLASRVRLYALCQGVATLLSVWETLAEGDVWAFPLWPWLVSGVVLAVVLGTFPAVTFSRNRRGQVRLVRTWRVCFVPLRPRTVPVEEYDGVTTGTEYQSGILEWLIAIILLFYGIVPGVLWWYHVIQRNLYYVSLCRDHGFPEQCVYRGKDEGQMKEITKVLQSVFLP